MLTPDKVRYECGVKINEKIIPDSARATKTIASHVKVGQPMKPLRAMTPIGVTIHNTADLKNVNDDAEQYTRATWPNCNMSGVVVHYYVDDQGAWQNLREDEHGWHAADGSGNGNRKTIAIECIMDGSGSKEDLGAYDNAARLIASILFRYNWTLSNLYTHNHWMGQPDKIVSGVRKNCPIYILPKYDDFKKLVQKYLDGLKDEKKAEAKPAAKPATTPAKPAAKPATSTVLKSGDSVVIAKGAVYGGLTNARGKACPNSVIGKTYTIYSIQSNKGQTEALLMGINSWVPVKYLSVSGPIGEGSKVKIKSGAVYGGLSITRGKKVPKLVVGKTLTVKKIQTNKGVKEALLKEIFSWVAVDSLIKA